LVYEENPQTHQVYIVNNTLDVYTITDIDEYGDYFWMVYPYPDLPYEIPVGDSLTLDVYFECITEQIFGYVYEDLNITSETDTHTVVISINEDLLIGIQNHKDDLLQVYPNPAKDYLTFTLKSDQFANYELLIFNSFGKIIKSYVSGINREISWDCTNEENQKVAPGIYYYSLISDKHQESGKIMLVD